MSLSYGEGLWQTLVTLSHLPGNWTVYLMLIKRFKYITCGSIFLLAVQKIKYRSLSKKDGELQELRHTPLAAFS